MRRTVVPAQVTTVEDRIMGNLGFSQMMLLLVPIFFSAGVYILLPPFMGLNLAKYTAIAIVTPLFCILAIRIKGKIVAFWIATILRYNLRPKYYLFKKATAEYRELYEQKKTEREKAKVATKTKRVTAAPKLAIHELAEVLAAIDNPAANLRFETTKKGGLHVRLTEIEK